MKRLRNSAPQTNTPEDYDKIFLNRQLKKPDPYDVKRWNLLMKYFVGDAILDIGCLDSRIPQMAKKKYPNSEVWGLDQAKEPIEYLRRRNPDIYYLRGDLYNTELPAGHFDYVVLGEVLEHLEEPEKAIKEAMRVIKPGGWLAVSVPLGETEKGEVDGLRHLWSFTMGSIIKLLKPYGEVKTKVIGSEHLPVYKYHFPTIIGWVKKNEQI